MIYATEQQVVVTAAAVVTVGVISLLIGILWGLRRGRQEAEEEQGLQRQQYGPRVGQAGRGLLEWKLRTMNPPHVAHEERLAHENQALTLANDELIHEWHDHPPLKYGDEGVRGCPACEAHWECPPSAAITTGEIQAITSEMDAWMAEHIYGRAAP